MEIYDAVSINWLATFVASLVSMVVGSIWYSGPVFGKVWQKAIGLSDEQMKQGAGKAMATAYVFSAVTAVAMAMMVDWVGASTWLEAIYVAIFVWLGFVVTAYVINTSFEQSRGVHTWLFLGNHGLTLLGMSLVLTLWT